MEIYANKTQKGTKSFPLHKHNCFEVMLYLRGEGVMRSETGDIPFSPGTIILMPPHILHGSHSSGEFVNISIESDFENHFYAREPVSFIDNEDGEGRILAELIYKNRFGNKAYLYHLCFSYANYILTNNFDDALIYDCVKRIISQISDNAFNSEVNITSFLKESGYSEDYIRACFKKETGKTPMEFLTEVRIGHARYLIDIYKSRYTLAEIAEKCGYTDYVYFSKKFKELVGVSPLAFKNRC